MNPLFLREVGLILQIGKTKVFLRAGQMAELDARRAQKLATAAKTIQRKIRTHIARKYFLALQKAAICLQSSCRGLSFIISWPMLYKCKNKYHVISLLSFVFSRYYVQQEGLLANCMTI